MAHGNERVIGNDNTLPWFIKEDLAMFRKLTTGNTLLMGRKTFESIGVLPNRKTVVVSTTMNKNDYDVDIITSIDTLPYDNIFIVGGAELYRATLCDTDILIVTSINGDFEGDTYFPQYANKLKLVKMTETITTSNGYTLTVGIYVNSINDTTEKVEELWRLVNDSFR